jgi:riboflavin kinase/FMN adenylyltransferase
MRLLAAAERLARAAGLQRVHIGFTPHPDLLMRGATPLQLLDAGELELRMAGAGVDLWCDLPFTPETRDTPWEDFIERLVGVTAAKSIVLSPESAFGQGRKGTLPNVRAWGAAHGLQVHPVAEATAGGAPIRSTRIREAVVGGDLTGAARLLARPYALAGTLQGDEVRLQPSEAAVPPPGEYRARVGVAGRPEGRLPLVGRLTTVRVNADGLTITLVRPDAADRRFEGGPIRVALLGGSLQA